MKLPITKTAASKHDGDGEEHAVVPSPPDDDHAAADDGDEDHLDEGVRQHRAVVRSACSTSACGDPRATRRPARSASPTGPSSRNAMYSRPIAVDTTRTAAPPLARTISAGLRSGHARTPPVVSGFAEPRRLVSAVRAHALGTQTGWRPGSTETLNLLCPWLVAAVELPRHRAVESDRCASCPRSIRTSGDESMRPSTARAPTRSQSARALGGEDADVEQPVVVAGVGKHARCRRGSVPTLPTSTQAARPLNHVRRRR